MKKGVLILLLIIVATSVFAFRTKIDKVEDTITLDELAVFNLTIFNDQNKLQEYNIRTLDFPQWDIYTKPVLNPISLKVDGKNQSSIILYVDPLNILGVGTVDVKGMIKAKNGEKKIVPFRVSVVSKHSKLGEYMPAIVSNLDMPKIIDPRDEFTIGIVLDNRNILEFDELTITINSKTLNKEVVESLGAKERKNLELQVRLPPKTSPQEDKLTFSILYEGEPIGDPKTMKFRIKSYSDVKTTESVSWGFLKKIRDISFSNSGNADFNGNVTVETSKFRSMFTFTNPKGIYRLEGENKFIDWEVTIPSNDKISIRVTENYMVLLIILIILIVATIFYQMSKTPLSVRKEASSIEKHEGGITELKVVLTVRNVSKDPIRDIKLRDKIPKIANLEKDLDIGTLQPSNILNHHKKGSIIKWQIDELGPGDERIISYRIKSSLSIIGDFALSGAKASYHYKGKHLKSVSRDLVISA